MAIGREMLCELIEHLEGTCSSLSYICDELDIDENDISKEEMEELDDRIFECADCGWWYEIGQQSSDYTGECVCTDCGIKHLEEEEDEED